MRKYRESQLADNEPVCRESDPERRLIPVPSMQSNRFVLFEPQASRVELTGSFNNWQRVGMKRIGNCGYWELSLHLPAGEYHYAYILDENRRMVDPTISVGEKDDFGGENSILSLEVPI